VIKSDDKKDTNIFQQGWASNPEYNPPGFAIDHSFRRHVIRHTNKLIIRIHYLYLMEHEIITKEWTETCANPEISHTEIQFKTPVLGEAPHAKWDADCDKSLLIGIYRHGMENNDLIRADENLCFNEKLGEEFITTTEINTRFKKLIQNHMRQTDFVLQNQVAVKNTIKQNLAARGNWTKEEEDDFIRVLINYGVWDQTVNEKVNIRWTKFRERASSLSKKTDAQMMENLYCVLARCSKVQNSSLGEPDEVRAQLLERIPEKKCLIILHRLTLMRKVHINAMAKDPEVRRTHIRMLPMDKMPKGWTYELDERLFSVADTFGINQIGKKLATLSEFKNIDLPANKDLWRRLYDIVLTLESGKYGPPPDNIPYDEESDDEREDELWLLALSNAGKQALTNVPAAVLEPSSTSSRRTQNKKKPLTTSTPTTSKKDINSAHQNFVKQMDQAAYQQNYLLLQAAAALSGKPGSSTNDVVAQIAQLQAILQLANPTLTTSNFNKAIEDALNLSKKDTPSTAVASSSKASTSTPAATTASSSTPSTSQKHSTAAPAAVSSSSSSTATTKAATASSSSSSIPPLNPEDAAAFEKAALEQLGIGFSELMVLQSLDPNVTVCMYNPETKHSITGEKAPTLKTLEAWIKTNPKYKVDFNSTLMALALMQQQKPSTSTPKASSSKAPLQNGISNCASTSSTPKPSTAAASSSSSNLEPGEIPKASTSSSQPKTSTPSTNSLTSEYENLTITVFNKKTLMAAANDKHPTIKGLQTYLDKNPDMNVASSHAAVAKAVLPKSYHNRIGGDEYFAQLMAMMGMNQNYLTGGSLPGTSSTSNYSLTSGTSGGNSNNTNSNAAAQQAFEAQMMLLQQSMNPLNSYNYASLFTGMPGATGGGLTAANLSQFTTPTSSTATTKASTSSAKPSISAGTSSKSAAANAAAAAAAASSSSAGTASTSAISNSNTTASQMLSEAALTAELMNSPQFAQFMLMNAAAGTGTSGANQNQLNSLYGMDQNTLNQLQTISMLSMMSGLSAAATTPSSGSTSNAAKPSEKKPSAGSSSTSTPTTSKKSLGKIVEDLSKTPSSSS
jgi:hypothetical protein